MEIKKFSKFNEELEYPGLQFDKDKRIVQSWVNVKIDSDLPLRISRYARALDEYVNSKDLNSKLDILSSPDSAKYGSQCKLAIVVLLQYLKEVKSNFDPSSSGYLFENFIAGLLHAKKAGGYTSHDFEEEDGTKCQIKFYREKTPNIIVNHKNPVDKYIIGLKSENKADIWIIDRKGNFKIDEYLIQDFDDKGKVIKSTIDVSSLKFLRDTSTLESKKPYTLKFDNVEKIIESVSEGLSRMIEILYDNISELNYNIETIITGVSKEKKIVPLDDMDKYYNDSMRNMKEIDKEIKDVKRTILSSVRRTKF